MSYATTMAGSVSARMAGPPPDVLTVLFWNVVFLVRGSVLATLLVLSLEPLLPTEALGWSEKKIFVVGSIAVHESLYFGLCGLLLFQDTQGSSGWAWPYKIHRKPWQQAPWAQVKRTILRGSASHAVMQPLAMYFLFDVFYARGLRCFAPIPDVVTVFWHLAACQLGECFLFYAAHRLLHTPFVGGPCCTPQSPNATP